jgi:long-chain acyl-CoA synthetase
MNPLTVFPLAVAAGGGRVGAFEAQQLVAAGLTLLQRSAPLVRALAGRRAAILLPTGHQFYVALAACEGRGAVLVNPLAAPAEIAHQLRDADVGAVFTVTPFAARLPEGTPMVLLDDAPRTARVVAGGATKDVDLGAHFGLDLEAESDVAGSDEECVIVYTSAMAGTPRGAILTHRNILANARSTLVAAGITRDDHALAVLPFSHLFGLVVSGAAPLLAGGRVTPMERFHPGKAIEALEAGDVTQFVAVPAVYATMVAMLERRGARLASERLRLCICGGAVLAPELQDAWAELTGVELRQGYGLTEAGPVCLFNRVQLPNRRGTLGVPFPDVEVEIHDARTGARLPQGTDGEICVRGPNVFAGYVGGATDGLEVRDGWLHTGDRGVLNPDGTVTFLGLIKPMFTRNGFNVYPREIERVVGAMPGVTRVAVRAIPDPAKENDIALDVAGTVEAADVKAWCEARLSAYKQPTEINVTSS